MSLARRAAAATLWRARTLGTKRHELGRDEGPAKSGFSPYRSWAGRSFRIDPRSGKQVSQAIDRDIGGKELGRFLPRVFNTLRMSGIRLSPLVRFGVSLNPR
jgi:hypothetical protein